MAWRCLTALFHICRSAECNGLHALSCSEVFSCGYGNRGRQVAIDILYGLCHLHRNNVIHFDLKSNNILLSSDGRQAKLADTGLALAMLSQTHLTNNEMRCLLLHRL